MLKNKQKSKKLKKSIDRTQKTLYNIKVFSTTEYDPLAQPAEHLTFNQGVRSSNLRWITKKTVTTLVVAVFCFYILRRFELTCHVRRFAVRQRSTALKQDLSGSLCAEYPMDHQNKTFVFCGCLVFIFQSGII